MGSEDGEAEVGVRERLGQSRRLQADDPKQHQASDRKIEQGKRRGKEDTLARPVRVPQNRRRLSLVSHGIGRGDTAAAPPQDAGRVFPTLRQVGSVGANARA